MNLLLDVWPDLKTHYFLLTKYFIQTQKQMNLHKNEKIIIFCSLHSHFLIYKYIAVKKLCSVKTIVSLHKNAYKKLIVSDDRDRFVGKDGLREIGVFLRDSFTSASLMVVNGNLLFGS